MTTKPTFDRFDYTCLAMLTASLAVISITSPALYVILWIVAGLIAIAAFSFVVTRDLLGSDCPFDNAMGINALVSVVRLVGILIVAMCGVSNE